jgi:hypothetical protein
MYRYEPTLHHFQNALCWEISTNCIKMETPVNNELVINYEMWRKSLMSKLDTGYTNGVRFSTRQKSLLSRENHAGSGANHPPNQ